MWTSCATRCYSAFAPAVITRACIRMAWTAVQNRAHRMLLQCTNSIRQLVQFAGDLEWRSRVRYIRQISPEARPLERRTILRGLALAIASAARMPWVGAAIAAEQAMSRSAVRSVDGTPISFTAVGNGRPIVIAHESLETGNEWRQVAIALSDRFACYSVDRRGHGMSGTAAHHSLMKECEDLKAVLDRAGPDATLLGASYGAVVAIETAMRFSVDRLILYEPPLCVTTTSAVCVALENSLTPYERLVEAGDLEAALTFGLRNIAGASDEAIAELRTSSPEIWSTMKQLTPTWIPEMRALRVLPAGLERYRSLQAPTLLVTGSDSASFLRETIMALSLVLEASRIHVLEGQGHEAHLTAPDQLSAAIAEFLS